MRCGRRRFIEYCLYGGVSALLLRTQTKSIAKETQVESNLSTKPTEQFSEKATQLFNPISLDVLQGFAVKALKVVLGKIKSTNPTAKILNQDRKAQFYASLATTPSLVGLRALTEDSAIKLLDISPQSSASIANLLVALADIGVETHLAGPMAIYINKQLSEGRSISTTLLKESIGYSLKIAPSIDTLISRRDMLDMSLLGLSGILTTGNIAFQVKPGILSAAFNSRANLLPLSPLRIAFPARRKIYLASQDRAQQGLEEALKIRYGSGLSAYVTTQMFKYGATSAVYSIRPPSTTQETAANDLIGQVVSYSLFFGKVLQQKRLEKTCSESPEEIPKWLQYCISFISNSSQNPT